MEITGKVSDEGGDKAPGEEKSRVKQTSAGHHQSLLTNHLSPKPDRGVLPC